MPELTGLLFRHGMNPNHRGWLGATPLHEFARKGDVEKALCSTPLGCAAKFGKIAMVELLLALAAMTNLPGDPPWATPLAWATRHGYGQIAALLKQHGAQ